MADILNDCKLNEIKISTIRKYLVNSLEKYQGEPILFDDFPEGLLEEVLFSPVLKRSKKYLNFAIPQSVAKKIDMSNVSFDNFLCENYDFSGYTGIKIDPERSISDFKGASFNGVTFLNPIKNRTIELIDFRGSVGASIDPSSNTMGTQNKFCDVTFTGPFQGVTVKDDNFSGSHGAVIFTEVGTDLTWTTLTDARIQGGLDDCIINCTNFSGAKNLDDSVLRINPNIIRGKFRDCVFDGVEFTQPVKKLLEIAGADFTGSQGFEISPDNIASNDISGCKLAGVKFCCANKPLRCFMDNTDFTGSTGAIVDFDLNSNIHGTNFADAQFVQSVGFDNILYISKKYMSARYGDESLFYYVTGLKEKVTSDVNKVLVKIDKALMEKNDI